MGVKGGIGGRKEGGVERGSGGMERERERDGWRESDGRRERDK